VNLVEFGLIGHTLSEIMKNFYVWQQAADDEDATPGKKIVKKLLLPGKDRK